MTDETEGKAPRLQSYKLVDRVAVPCDFIEAFTERSKAFQETGEDPWDIYFDDLGNGCVVSTIFLGFDHNYFDTEPSLFETAVFLKDHGLVEVTGRCATWKQAEEQHDEAFDFAAAYRHLRVVK